MTSMASVNIRNGIKLGYDAWGKGKPVVFLHAWSLDRSFWENQMFALKNDFHVVAYDHRGHGSSDRPDGPYDMETYATDLRDVLTELRLERVTLVAWSMGAWVACNYMAKFGGERVEKLVLQGASTRLINTPDYSHAFDGAMIQALAAEMARDRAKATDGFYRSLLNKGASPQMLDWIVRVSLATPLPVAMPSFQSVLGDDLSTKATAIKVPTLVLHGEQDGVPVSAAHDLAKHIPNARVATFANSGHFPQLEEATSYTETLARFLAD
jgi:non-heme chloroperoxidase